MSTVTDYFYYYTYYPVLFWGFVRTYIQPYWSTKTNIHQVTDNLFISDLATTYNTPELDKLGITHIISAMLGLRPAYPDKYKYCNIHIRDIPDEPIDEHFNTCIDFIDKAMSDDPNNKVLVHCSLGVSRSATIVLAYLMKTNKWDLSTALSFLKNKRDIINPNVGFRQKLNGFNY